ncbi:MAG: type 2 lantipeptide synthetase LanM [Lactobacillaceae bacterium]|jgi:type 2 lantibiotic biosynthesis protein LanM|nr:type 2 lantipeptide synthetase LanM [Lactobacillaceae bacterium]
MNTSEFKLESKTVTMPGANNIPKIGDFKVSYQEYNDNIIQGFEKMMYFFLNNKDDLLSNQGQLNRFNDKKIRIIIKNTQKYAEMLDFLKHPNCSTLMLKKECTLQNIWAYPYKNKDVIKSEYRDLLMGDIPLFNTTVSSRNLYDGYNVEYHNYFKKDGMTRVKERISELNKDIIDKQKDLLIVYLSQFNKYKNTEFQRTSYMYSGNEIDYIYEAEKIAEEILNNAIETNNEINWPVIQVDPSGDTLGLCDIGLYEGLSGIAVFFLELFDATKKIKYYHIYKKCMQKMVDSQEQIPVQLNISNSKISLLYPIYLEMELTSKSDYLHVIEPILRECLEKIKSQDVIQSDWLTGNVGLLNIVTLLTKNINLYHYGQNKHLVDLLVTELANQIRSIDVLFDGQAHGRAGVAYALSLLYKSKPNEDVLARIINLVSEEVKSLQREKNNDERWCNGLTGIASSYVKILNNTDDNVDVQNKLDTVIDLLLDVLKDTHFVGDSLCHGNAGTILALQEYIQNRQHRFSEVTEIKDKLIQDVVGRKLVTNNYQLLKLSHLQNCTLYTGLAGVGYMLLKQNTRLKNNVLMLT